MKQKTNFLVKIQEKERKEAMRESALNRIVEEGKLPKLVELAIECAPTFNGNARMRRHIEYAIDILRRTTDDVYLWMALSWEPSKREKLLGSEWELPVRVAYCLLIDLKDGRDVFNPSAEDVRTSKLFSRTIMCYIPEILGDEFTKAKKSLVEELIEKHSGDLAPNHKLKLMSERDMVLNMHPEARMLFNKEIKKTHLSGASFNSLADFYETLSEVLKAYESKQEWDDDSVEERCKRVPEYFHIGGVGRYNINEMIGSLLP